jgi:hypothetical protein
MAQGLSVVAAMFSSTLEALDWAGLRCQHTPAIRRKLVETRTKAGINKAVAASCARLGSWLMDRET